MNNECCPCCGEIGNRYTVYYRNRAGEIVGCSECLEEVNPEEYEEEQDNAEYERQIEARINELLERDYEESFGIGV